MRVILCLFALVFGLSPLLADDKAAPWWPLSKGTFWVYEGDVSWVDKDPATGQNQVNNKHLTWRSEVVDVVEKRGAVLLHGFPTDLAWYKSDTKPSDTLILQVGPDYYRVRNKPLEVFQMIKGGYPDPPNGHPDPNTAELFLPTPLALGKQFGMGDTIIELFSSRYCSLVENVAPFDLRTVKNAPKLDHPLSYGITFHTTPDNDEVDFVPGLGITYYYYLHHGTTMEVSIRLLEFGQPASLEIPKEKMTRAGPD